MIPVTAGVMGEGLALSEGPAKISGGIARVRWMI